MSVVSVDFRTVSVLDLRDVKSKGSWVMCGLDPKDEGSGLCCTVWTPDLRRTGSGDFRIIENLAHGVVWFKGVRIVKGSDSGVWGYTEFGVMEDLDCLVPGVKDSRIRVRVYVRVQGVQGRHGVGGDRNLLGRGTGNEGETGDLPRP